MVSPSTCSRRRSRPPLSNAVSAVAAAAVSGKARDAEETLPEAASTAVALASSSAILSVPVISARVAFSSVGAAKSASTSASPFPAAWKTPPPSTDPTAGLPIIDQRVDGAGDPLGSSCAARRSKLSGVWQTPSWWLQRWYRRQEPGGTATRRPGQSMTCAGRMRIETRPLTCCLAAAVSLSSVADVCTAGLGVVACTGTR
mmetsp:Transcript_20404/g.62257  ORF Transcript_20404/g.62257 Transcript_20404/m.62257 type:complete len:201 (+) Transcript_20404:396-998(+)